MSRRGTVRTVVAVVAAAAATVGALTVVASAASFTTASQPFSAQASTLDLTALSYVGQATDSGVPVLQFSADEMTFGGYTEADPCLVIPAGVGTDTHRAASTWAVTGTVSSPVVLDATRLAYSYGGQTYEWTPASAPPSGFSLTASVTAVELTATALDAPRATGDVDVGADMCSSTATTH